MTHRMKEFILATPVVFIIFNRPELAARVFSEIVKVRPTQLFVISDGPRTNICGEATRVAQSRAIIDRVNWPCKIFTNYSDHNMGCRARVSSGLDWVFQQVKEAIILEDDCLPDITFFRFCQELLEKYRHDQRVGMISGDNFQFDFVLNNDSYYFSNINHIWGWATWRDRWQNDYDVDLKEWPKIRDENRVQDWYATQQERDAFAFNLARTHALEINTWDYQWNFGSRLNGRLSIMPNVNLISNIGFGVEATHTKEHNEFSNLPTTPIVFPLKHPKAIFASEQLDSRFFQLSAKQTLTRRFKLWLKKSFGLS